jgi:hypothetical protein
VHNHSYFSYAHCTCIIHQRVHYQWYFSTSIVCSILQRTQTTSTALHSLKHSYTPIHSANVGDTHQTLTRSTAHPVHSHSLNRSSSTRSLAQPLIRYILTRSTANPVHAHPLNHSSSTYSLAHHKSATHSHASQVSHTLTRITIQPHAHTHHKSATRSHASQVSHTLTRITSQPQAHTHHKSATRSHASQFSQTLTRITTQPHAHLKAAVFTCCHHLQNN